MDWATLERGIGARRRVIATTWAIAPECGLVRTSRRRKPLLTGIDLGMPDRAEMESRDRRRARRPLRRST